MVYVLNLTPRHPRSVGSGKHNMDNDGNDEVSPRSTIDFDDYNHGNFIGCKSCGAPDIEESALRPAGFSASHGTCRERDL